MQEQEIRSALRLQQVAAWRSNSSPQLAFGDHPDTSGDDSIARPSGGDDDDDGGSLQSSSASDDSYQDILQQVDDDNMYQTETRRIEAEARVDQGDEQDAVEIGMRSVGSSDGQKVISSAREEANRPGRNTMKHLVARLANQPLMCASVDDEHNGTKGWKSGGWSISERNRSISNRWSSGRMERSALPSGSSKVTSAKPTVTAGSPIDLDDLRPGFSTAGGAQDVQTTVTSAFGGKRADLFGIASEKQLAVKNHIFRRKWFGFVYADRDAETEYVIFLYRGRRQFLTISAVTMCVVCFSIAVVTEAFRSDWLGIFLCLVGVLLFGVGSVNFVWLTLSRNYERSDKSKLATSQLYELYCIAYGLLSVVGLSVVYYPAAAICLASGRYLLLTAPLEPCVNYISFASLMIQVILAVLLPLRSVASVPLILLVPIVFIFTRWGNEVDSKESMSLHLATRVFFSVVMSIVSKWNEGNSRRLFEDSLSVKADVRRTLSMRRELDSALEALLPRHVVDRLIARRPVIDHANWAVVMICEGFDFQNWTTKVLPTDIVHIMNAVYTSFDDVVKKYDIDKMKAVGDRYIVTSGLQRTVVPTEQTNRTVRNTLTGCENESQIQKVTDAELQKEMAVRCGCAGLHFQKVVQQLNGKLETPFAVRVALHAGSLIGALVGNKSMGYEVFGPTLEISLRLSSVGTAGSVVCTEVVQRAYTSYFVDAEGLPFVYDGPMTTFRIKSVRRHAVNASSVQNKGGVRAHPSKPLPTANPIKIRALVGDFEQNPKGSGFELPPSMALQFTAAGMTSVRRGQQPSHSPSSFGFPPPSSSCPSEQSIGTLDETPNQHSGSSAALFEANSSTSRGDSDSRLFPISKSFSEGSATAQLLLAEMGASSAARSTTKGNVGAASYYQRLRYAVLLEIVRKEQSDPNAVQLRKGAEAVKEYAERRSRQTSQRLESSFLSVSAHDGDGSDGRSSGVGRTSVLSEQQFRVQAQRHRMLLRALGMDCNGDEILPNDAVESLTLVQGSPHLSRPSTSSVDGSQGTTERFIGKELYHVVVSTLKRSRRAKWHGLWSYYSIVNLELSFKYFIGFGSRTLSALVFGLHIATMVFLIVCSFVDLAMVRKHHEKSAVLASWTSTPLTMPLSVLSGKVDGGLGKSASAAAVPLALITVLLCLARVLLFVVRRLIFTDAMDSAVLLIVIVLTTLSVSSMPHNSFNYDLQYLMLYFLCLIGVVTRFWYFAAGLCLVTGATVWACNISVVGSVGNISSTFYSLYLCMSLGVIAAALVKERYERSHFESVCFSSALLRAMADEVCVLESVQSMMFPRHVISVVNDLCLGRADPDLVFLQSISDLNTLEIRMDSFSSIVLREIRRPVAAVEFAERSLVIIETLIDQVNAKARSRHPKAIGAKRDVLSKVHSCGDVVLYAGPIDDLIDDEKPTNAAVAPTGNRRKESTSADFERWTNATVADERRSGSRRKGRAALKSAPADDGQHSDQSDDWKTEERRSWASARSIVEVMCSVLRLRETLAAQMSKVASDATQVLQDDFLLSCLSAVACSGSGFATVLGIRRVSFNVFGVVTRQSASLLGAAPPNFLGCNDAFRRLLADSGVVLPLPNSTAEFAPPQRWRVRGCGLVTMHALCERRAIPDRPCEPEPVEATCSPSVLAADVFGTKFVPDLSQFERDGGRAIVAVEQWPGAAMKAWQPHEGVEMETEEEGRLIDFGLVA